MIKLEYCEKCNSLREYKVKNERYEIKFQHIIIKYNGRIAICRHCGTEVFCEEVEEYNQKAFERGVK